MDGLTNIIEKIAEQSRLECENVTSHALDEAKKILNDAELEAKALVSKIKEEADNKASVIKSRAESSAELEYKRAILSQKSKVIDSVIEKAKSAIAGFDDEKYFGCMLKLVSTNALSGKGELKFAKADLKRMPKEFEKQLEGVLGEGKIITVSNETVDDIGGFVIEYPEMKVDCTISSLVLEKSDEIKDEINRILFA